MKSRLFIRCIYIWLWPVRHVIMKPDGQLIIKFPPQQKQSTVSFYFYLFFFQFKNLLKTPISEVRNQNQNHHHLIYSLSHDVES